MKEGGVKLRKKITHVQICLLTDHNLNHHVQNNNSHRDFYENIIFVSFTYAGKNEQSLYEINGTPFWNTIIQFLQ